MNKVELLAPAGDLEKLKTALMYGADAVYCAGEIFGLRAKAKNMTTDDLREGVQFAHEHGKKVYLVLNIIPHNEDIAKLGAYLEEIKDIPVDAFILSDPGTLLYIKEKRPNAEIHLSTQANNTNYLSASFWHQQGVARVILARELSIKEVSDIVTASPETLEYEAFVHGAMCISYSGRCLMSNYMSNRDANRGDCAQPCRWKYHLVEEKRPGEYFPVEETEQGTFFFNSKDLCMIEYIPELIQSGLKSLKIEGRMKSIHYVATIVRTYREAIDRYYADPEHFVYDPQWFEEIKKASNRDFTSGFFFEKPDQESQHYTNSSYFREVDFVGIVRDYCHDSKMALVEQRNRMFVGETVEIIGPNQKTFNHTIQAMYNDKKVAIDVAQHAQMLVWIPFNEPLAPYSILRREKRD